LIWENNMQIPHAQCVSGVNYPQMKLTTVSNSPKNLMDQALQQTMEQQLHSCCQNIELIGYLTNQEQKMIYK
jgi:hypothetical protein